MKQIKKMGGLKGLAAMFGKGGLDGAMPGLGNALGGMGGGVGSLPDVSKFKK
jgi:signal recognition particle subunit SRP54